MRKTVDTPYGFSTKKARQGQKVRLLQSTADLVIFGNLWFDFDFFAGFSNAYLTLSAAKALVLLRGATHYFVCQANPRSRKLHIYLSIDDTDNLDSPGSGQLAEALAGELQQERLALTCSNISRHQLFVHETIPFTSHNSSMCFLADTDDEKLADIIEFARQFLRRASAPGSDPGLCVAVESKFLDREALTAFGLKAKKTVLSKQDAYWLANKTGVHLSEHGGTGDGIIGALAGTGLRLQGNDGRFRGWLDLGERGTITNPQSLCRHSFVDGVVDDNGRVLSDETPVFLADSRIKTILCNHRQVIPVTPATSECGAAWQTLTKNNVKRF